MLPYDIPPTNTYRSKSAVHLLSTLGLFISLGLSHSSTYSAGLASASSSTHKTPSEASKAPLPAGTKTGGVTDTQPATASEIMSQAKEEVTVGAVYSLPQLLDLAKRENPAIVASRAQSLAARAGITTARAYPNPEIDYVSGRQRARLPGIIEGNTSAFAIAQRIENPALRNARSATAEASANIANTNIRITEANVIAEVKVRYFNVLRREQEVGAAREDKLLTEQIRERVKVKVQTGESARFDLIRADTEVANSAKQLTSAILRLAQAKAELRQVISLSMPEDFVLRQDVPLPLAEPDFALLEMAFLQNNPELKKSIAEISRAEKRIDVEKQSILPSVAIRVGQGRDPDIRSSQVGLTLAIPLWDRRQGPIAEASAELSRVRSEADLRRLELENGLTATWAQYKAAKSQVDAIEGTILVAAKRALDIAESAYRYGERGILEFLDAQRQFRLIRNELISARFDLQVARAELERLAARDLASYDDISPISKESKESNDE